MAHRSATPHDVMASDEFDPLVVSRRQLVLMVIGLRRRLDEHWVKANRERELIAIHCDTTEHEREVIQVNHQLLTQIKVLREAHQAISEPLSWAPGRLRWTPPRGQPTPAAPTDLRFKLNKMAPK